MKIIKIALIIIAIVLSLCSITLNIAVLSLFKEIPLLILLGLETMCLALTISLILLTYYIIKHFE